MKVVATHSHKQGMEFIERYRQAEYGEVCEAIGRCDAVACLSKKSDERTKPPLLFSPVEMNRSIKVALSERGWTDASPGSKKGFKEPKLRLGAREFREMDGIKNKVGLEVQFGKYAFMGYDIFAKMPIFAKHGLIDCGIEVVVMSSMLRDMSTGVSSFEQIVLDMQHRGVADIDLPTLVVGIAPTPSEIEACHLKRQRFAADPAALLKNGEVAKGFSGSKPGPKGDRSAYFESEQDDSAGE